VFGQPIPHRLLIEALLVSPLLVARRRPEPRAIRRKHLVRQHNLPRLLVDTKLELRVRNDDPPPQRVGGRGLVDRKRQVFHLGRILGPDQGRSLGGVNILVVLPDGRLGARRVQRLGQAAALPDAGRHVDPVDGAPGPVFLPGRPRQVPAHDGLDGQDAELADLHAPALEQRPLGRRERDRGREGRGDEVGPEAGDEPGQEVEPELGGLGEDGALVRDGGREDHVIG